MRLTFLSITPAALVLRVQLSPTRCGGRGSLPVLHVSDFCFKVPVESSWYVVSLYEQDGFIGWFWPAL